MIHLEKRSKIGREINLESPWRPWIDQEYGWLEALTVRAVQKDFGEDEERGRNQG